MADGYRRSRDDGWWIVEPAYGGRAWRHHRVVTWRWSRAPQVFDATRGVQTEPPAATRRQPRKAKLRSEGRQAYTAGTSQRGGSRVRTSNCVRPSKPHRNFELRTGTANCEPELRTGTGTANWSTVRIIYLNVVTFIQIIKLPDPSKFYTIQLTSNGWCGA